MDAKKVLVVEDNKQLQQLFVSILSKEGHEIDVADNGQEAVQKALHNQYDLITMDLLMPRLNGMEAIKKIRRFKKDTRIVVITAYPKDQNVKTIKEFGIDDVLVKPITAQHVRELMLDV